MSHASRSSLDKIEGRIHTFDAIRRHCENEISQLVSHKSRLTIHKDGCCEQMRRKTIERCIEIFLSRGKHDSDETTAQRMREAK